MLAHGVLNCNGSQYADYLIAYHGNDKLIGYNHIQNKAEFMARAEPEKNWTFDYKVLSESNSLHGVDLPDVTYVEVIAVVDNEIV